MAQSLEGDMGLLWKSGPEDNLILTRSQFDRLDPFQCVQNFPITVIEACVWETIKAMEKTLLLVLMFAAAATVRAGAQNRPEKGSVYKHATFAGGCFWCMEPSFEKLQGVAEVSGIFRPGGRFWRMSGKTID
jgi:hypothetical protein